MTPTLAIPIFVMANIVMTTMADQSAIVAISSSYSSEIEDGHTNFVRRKARSLARYYTDNLVDSMETAYDEFSQAWRMLGMYIDCGDDSSVMANNAQRYRRMEQANANDGENVDGDDGDAAADNNNVGDDGVDNNNNAQGACNRYLLWGAVSRKIQFYV
jgi:hypothetical protein